MKGLAPPKRHAQARPRNEHVHDDAAGTSTSRRVRVRGSSWFESGSRKSTKSKSKSGSGSGSGSIPPPYGTWLSWTAQTSLPSWVSTATIRLRYPVSRVRIPSPVPSIPIPIPTPTPTRACFAFDLFGRTQAQLRRHGGLWTNNPFAVDKPGNLPKLTRPVTLGELA